MDNKEVSQTGRDSSLMEIGLFECISLFAIFFVTISISAYLIARLFINIGSNPPSDGDIIYVLSLSSLSGSSIFYARKLYKAGINQSYNFNPTGLTVRRASTLAYFIIRLPTSILFSLLIYALWRLSIDIAIKSKFEAGSSPLYLFLVMGFFSGFSSGKFITYFERDGMKLARTGGADNEQS